MVDRDEDVMKALTRAWDRIQAEDSGVPDVSFYLTSGRSSSCATMSWEEAEPVLRVNLLHPDSSKLTGPEVMEFLLHQAAHASAGPSTGSEGRWHPDTYRVAAQGLGLDVTQGKNGWDLTTLARGTKTRYEPEISAINRALSSWEPVVVRKDTRNALRHVCQCDPPRAFRMTAGNSKKGPVVCGVCGQPFTVVS